MPLDAITLQALASELLPALVGARIEKVQQPEKDLLLLHVRGRDGGRKLLIAAGSGSARMHFTSEAPENPAQPPMFCMLLRKHLCGARILDLEQPEHERMLHLELESRDEMGDSARKSLVVEMMGRSSNVILIGADGRIIDCLRRTDDPAEGQRRLMPGMIYRMPPGQDKRSVFDLQAGETGALIAAADRSQPVDRWLLNTFSGLSPLLCRELAFLCEEHYDRLEEVLRELLDQIKTADFRPVLLTENGAPRDFSFREIKQFGSGIQNLRVNSFSELLDAFFAEKERLARAKRHSHDLLRTVRTARDRLQRKLTLQREELHRTEGREEKRKEAELLTANLYRVKSGDRELVCEDYYQDGCPEVRILLDPLKSPQQNLTARFREYRKLKAAAEHLGILIEQGERQLDYLESVLDEIERAYGEKELDELRRELSETGYIKRQKSGKSEKSRPQMPLLYRSDDGLDILVGRNNLQNDELTTKIARRTDYWLHTQKIHGSHVIVRCQGEAPPARTLCQAASLAVYHSRGRSAGKTAVDCTMVRYVRKPSGALPGKVIYTDYQTLIAEADESLAVRLQQKK